METNRGLLQHGDDNKLEVPKKKNKSKRLLKNPLSRNKPEKQSNKPSKEFKEQ